MASLGKSEGGLEKYIYNLKKKFCPASQTANFAITHIEVGREMHMYISGKKSQQTMSLCNLGRGIQRF